MHSRTLSSITLGLARGAGVVFTKFVHNFYGIEKKVPEAVHFEIFHCFSMVSLRSFASHRWIYPTLFLLFSALAAH